MYRLFAFRPLLFQPKYSAHFSSFIPPKPLSFLSLKKTINTPQTSPLNPLEYEKYKAGCKTHASRLIDYFPDLLTHNVSYLTKEDYDNIFTEKVAKELLYKDPQNVPYYINSKYSHLVPEMYKEIPKMPYYQIIKYPDIRINILHELIDNLQRSKISKFLPQNFYEYLDRTIMLLPNGTTIFPPKDYMELYYKFLINYQLIALSQIPDIYLTQELCNEFISIYGIEWFNQLPEIYKSNELCLMAVQENQDIIKYIPLNRISESICLYITNPNLLKFVPIQYQTIELCKLMLNQRPYFSIIEYFRPSYESYIFKYAICCGQNPNNIKDPRMKSEMLKWWEVNRDRIPDKVEDIEMFLINND